MNFIQRFFCIVQLSILLTGAAYGQVTDNTEATYVVDPENSILRVFVGRAGPLARMGHNHVVHSQELSGQILLSSNRVDSRAELSLPVDSLIVDDPDERARAGDDYSSQPGESAIAGTRENMLGEEVLNASQYPVINITATPIEAATEQWLLDVDIEFRGETFNQEIPARVEFDSAVLQVDARFTLDHEDLGLSPFAALGGALRVAEEIGFELLIEASSQAGNTDNSIAVISDIQKSD